MILAVKGLLTTAAGPVCRFEMGGDKRCPSTPLFKKWPHEDTMLAMPHSSMANTLVAVCSELLAESNARVQQECDTRVQGATLDLLDVSCERGTHERHAATT
jgi:hypothetical protein